MPFFAPGLTKAQYLSVLEAMLPVVTSWEAWAAVRAPEDVQPLLPPRRRAHLLRKDVAIFRPEVSAGREQKDRGATSGMGSGVDWDAVAGNVPAVGLERSAEVMGAASLTDSAAGYRSGMRGEDRGLSGQPWAALRAGFLGAWYVMEGSTLGGRFIARHVETVLGLEPGVGDAYFRGHGEATGGLWRETTALVAAMPDELSDVLIAAAKRTFIAFGAAVANRATHDDLLCEPAQR